VQHKRRGRPRLKDSAPSANTIQSERRPSYLQRHVSDDAWKLQSSPSFARDSYRRDYHHRSYSHGSHSDARHHPYADSTAPTSGYGTHGPSRNSSSYFDLPSPSATKTSYYPAPNSPNYYPSAHSPQLSSQHPIQTFTAVSSPYQSSHTASKEFQYSQPAPHSLLPLPDPHPSMLRTGSFPSTSRQSESSFFPQRPSLNRAETTPGVIQGIERRPEWGSDSEITGDSVTLPSLKDLGVPFR
jgi:hypothetical protein